MLACIYSCATRSSTCEGIRHETRCFINANDAIIKWETQRIEKEPKDPTWHDLTRSSRLHLLETSQSTILAPLTDMTSDNLTTTSRTASACRFCMRHLLISAKADWLADVRSFTRVVDYSRGSLSIAERALRFKLVQALLSPRLSCGMQAFEFRVDARWCEKRCNPVINTSYRSNFHAIILSRV